MHELDDSNLVLKVNVVHHFRTFDHVHHVTFLLAPSLNLGQLTVKLAFKLGLLYQNLLDFILAVDDLSLFLDFEACHLAVFVESAGKLWLSHGLLTAVLKRL